MIGIEQLRQELSGSDAGRERGWRLIGGRVVEASAAPLPEELPAGTVLARLDVEEIAPWSRPILTRVDVGRDFWIGDDSGRALVHVGEGGYLHPDVELHLDAPVTLSDEEQEGDVVRRTYVRALRTGDPVYVWGRPRLGSPPGGAGLSGYRDPAPVVEFSPSSVIHLYDEPAWRQVMKWRALPWYRKLSVLVRNR